MRKDTLPPQSVMTSRFSPDEVKMREMHYLCEMFWGPPQQLCPSDVFARPHVATPLLFFPAADTASPRFHCLSFLPPAVLPLDPPFLPCPVSKPSSPLSLLP